MPHWICPLSQYQIQVYYVLSILYDLLVSGVNGALETRLNRPAHVVLFAKDSGLLPSRLTAHAERFLGEIRACMPIA